MKNILLLFLSDVKVDKDTGIVRKTNYKEIGETETTNESAVRYLAKIKGAPPDKIFYFASNKVKSPIENFKVDNKEISHVEYFENCIAGDVVGDIKGVMQECKFDEEADISKTMESVIEMASKIQKYVETEKDDKVTLHVDMTGGMRHASLMMLVITRLIQYSGVKIGYILYSNFNRDRKEQFVEESNDIYNLFDLIAGAEEFVRFGSVEAIQSYFEGQKDVPDVLQDLLNAMKKFADAIKISRRMEFQKALEGLQNAYKKFNEEAGNISSLNYNLMQQMKSRISQEYAELLTNKADDYISIIDWCLAHGYIQQALTLYTESFPYLMITENKIVDVDSKFSKELAKQVAKDGMKREKEFFLLNEFAPKDYKTNSIFDAYESFLKLLHQNIKNIRPGKFDIEAFKKANTFEGNWEFQGIIKSDYDDYLNLLEDLQNLKNNPNLAVDIETVKEKLPTLYSFWYLIPKNIFEIPANGRMKNIFIALENTPQKNFTRKSNNTLIIHHMIKNEILHMNIDEEKFLQIIERYFIIKSERNDSAHARLITKEKSSDSNSEKTHAEFLKDYMKQGLDEYSEII